MRERPAPLESTARNADVASRLLLLLAADARDRDQPRPLPVVYALDPTHRSLDPYVRLGGRQPVKGRVRLRPSADVRIRVQPGFAVRVQLAQPADHQPQRTACASSSPNVKPQFAHFTVLGSSA